MNTTRFFLAACLAASLAAAAPAQDANLIPNRLSFAQVGESASYKLPNGYIQKLTVIKRSDQSPEAMVTVLVENIYDGRVVDAKEITEKAGDPFSVPSVPADPGVFVSVRNDIARVMDKDVVAGIVEINRNLGTEDQDVTEWWTCTDVPVFGIIKKVENGQDAWELVAWQESDGLPKKVVYGKDGSVRLVDVDASGETIADKAAAVLKAAQSTARGATESIADKAAAVMKAAAATASKAKDAVAEKASAAGAAIGDAASGAQESIADKAAAVMKAAAATATKAKDAVAEKASAAGEAIGDAASGAKESIADKAAAMMKAAAATATKAKDVVVEKASAAGQALGDAASGAKESIADKAAAVMKAASDKAAADKAADEAAGSLRSSGN